MDRNETITAIKSGLKRRSSTPWSVTGGRGTAWGWIRIHIVPRLRDDEGGIPEQYREELRTLLNLERVHLSGESIPSGGRYYEEYVARANGETPTVYGVQYWD